MIIIIDILQLYGGAENIFFFKKRLSLLPLPHTRKNKDS